MTRWVKIARSATARRGGLGRRSQLQPRWQRKQARFAGARIGGALGSSGFTKERVQACKGPEGLNLDSKGLAGSWAFSASGRAKLVLTH